MPEDPEKRKKHPYGTTLLARDTPENRKIWGNDVGTIDVASTICTDNGDCPYEIQPQPDDSSSVWDPTTDQRAIHILIASFRDRLCPRTLHNAFTNAKYPQRLFLRIIDQTMPHSDIIDDQPCWQQYCQQYNTDCQQYQHQVLTIPYDASNSKGPTDARSKLSQLIYWDYVHAPMDYKVVLHPVQPSDFCLQIDSHMDFSQDFDVELTAMYGRTHNDYAVLSTYVADISQNNQDIRLVYVTTTTIYGYILYPIIMTQQQQHSHLNVSPVSLCVLFLLFRLRLRL